MSGLQSADIELTALRDADLEPMFEWINDRELVLLNAAYSPVHESDHRAWFERVRSDGSVIFAIRELGSGRLIGSCQLLSLDRRHDVAVLQIRIGVADARGRGLGTQAVGLLLDHAFADLGLHRVQLEVFADNQRAIRAYEKAGFEREGVLREKALLDGRRSDVIVMAALASKPRPAP